MSSKYKFLDQSRPYFVSFAIIEWVDVFVRPNYVEILLDSLRYCQKNKGLVLYAWCVMPSHIHLIMGTSCAPMQDILRDFKSFTSRKLREEINSNIQESRKEWMLPIFLKADKQNSNSLNWQIWQNSNHPIELEGNQMIDQKMNYLHENPVKSGFVEHPEDWLYSSARDYAGKKGLLDIVISD